MSALAISTLAGTADPPTEYVPVGPGTAYMLPIIILFQSSDSSLFSQSHSSTQNTKSSTKTLATPMVTPVLGSPQASLEATTPTATVAKSNQAGHGMLQLRLLALLVGISVLLLY
jgi:hypothetical protein